MVSFYPPLSNQSVQPNAVHEQQARLKRFYRSLGVSAVAAELDKITREIDGRNDNVTVEQYVEGLELQSLAA